MNLPNKPWNEGETFTNDETGVKYTFDGEKWLAGGGAEADDATLTLINEVDRTAIMRDDALKKEHDEDHTKQSVINAGVVVSLDELFWRDVEIDQLTRDGDKALQEQIDAIEIPETDLSGYVSKTDSWDMALGTSLSVNILKNVDGGTPFVYYDGDPDGTHPCGLVNRGMMRDYVGEEIGKAPKSSPPMSAKLNAGFQMWSEGRLAEGCFNLLDEDQLVTSKIKSARFLTFHIIQGWDDCEWMSYALRGKGQIHLTDVDGKYQMSKFVLGAEKHDAASGTNPAGALWVFELEEYGFYPDMTLSGVYFLEFDSCLEEPA